MQAVIAGLHGALPVLVMLPRHASQPEPQ